MAKQRPNTFPSGTFIPIPQRLVATLQLCLAFSLLLWYLTQPFMGEYFALRSRMLIYEYVFGTSSLLKTKEGEKIQQEHAQRFEHLPAEEKKELIKGYQNLLNYMQRPALQKIESGIRSLIQYVPPFEQAWIFFSIFISILLLLKKEGSKQAAWLLPLIVVAFAIDNQMNGKNSSLPPDYILFPSEKHIIQNYLDEPFGTTPQKQKEQLEKGWKRYLIHHWSSNQSEAENQQLKQAEYNFSLARLQLLNSQPLSSWLHNYHEKLSLYSLILFLLWNSYFAWMFSRTMIKERLNIQLNN